MTYAVCRDASIICGTYIVLYCIVLYCIVLYCIVLYCIVLYCIVLYCIVLYCTKLCLRYIVLSQRVTSDADTLPTRMLKCGIRPVTIGGIMTLQCYAIQVGTGDPLCYGLQVDYADYLCNVTYMARCSPPSTQGMFF